MRIRLLEGIDLLQVSSPDFSSRLPTGEMGEGKQQIASGIGDGEGLGEENSLWNEQVARRSVGILRLLGQAS